MKTVLFVLCISILTLSCKNDTQSANNKITDIERSGLNGKVKTVIDTTYTNADELKGNWQPHDTINFSISIAQYSKTGSIISHTFIRHREAVADTYMRITYEQKDDTLFSYFFEKGKAEYNQYQVSISPTPLSESSITYSKDNGKWKVDDKGEIIYNKNNQIISITSTRYYGNEKNSSTYTYTYPSKDIIIATWKSGKETSTMKDDILARDKNNNKSIVVHHDGEHRSLHKIGYEYYE